MNDGLLNKKNDTSKIAEKYINKYISDLQQHMILSDNQVVQILNNCIFEYKIKNKMLHKISKKKWWQIFQKNITMNYNNKKE